MNISVFLVCLCLLTTTSALPEENLNVNDPFLIEGDIRLSLGEILGSRGSSARSSLWPKGVVPFVFSPKFAANSGAVWAAKAAMLEWHMTTCIRFRRRTTERDYVSFVIGNGCSSYVGKMGRGKQEISLGYGCHYQSVAVHEIGHALGFYHEQSRPDRDEYVTIKKGNIKTGTESNFRKYGRYFINSLGTPYDYSSIMHYGPYAFSKNGYRTIVPKKSGAIIGQRYGLSITDIKQMRKLYECKGKQFIEYGSGCVWWTKKAAHRCWRYCDPNSPKSGKWCWTNKSCASGLLGFAKGFCPGSVLFMPCSSSCGK